ncbi:MAG: Trypsin-like peptidase domain [Candidatus Parcubacteria bacterium]|jgi:hypothetical protein
MQFLTELLVSFLTAYLALTNILATELNTWFGPEPSTRTIIQEDDTSLSYLPSQIGQIIPDLLLKSGDYQRAALGSAVGLTGAGTKEPLDAIVNIFCTFTTDNYIRTTTGTGFFIDRDGVILTNAHVAQFILLEKTKEGGNTECIVRSGNPATAQYHAELLYISPAWIQKNASAMNEATPMGTGERDYALLYVDRRIDDAPLPAEFPALSFDTNMLSLATKNNIVTAAGYPATNILENGPSAELLARKATTSISELYTFGSNYADVISIRGSVVGAEGASGGPVVNSDGNVIGIIATRGNDQIDGEGSLRAITISHINRTITQETGFTLDENLSGNLSYRAAVFAKTLTPFLITILEQAR